MNGYVNCRQCAGVKEADRQRVLACIVCVRASTFLPDTQRENTSAYPLSLCARPFVKHICRKVTQQVSHLQRGLLAALMSAAAEEQQPRTHTPETGHSQHEWYQSRTCTQLHTHNDRSTSQLRTHTHARTEQDTQTYTHKRTLVAQRSQLQHRSLADLHIPGVNVATNTHKRLAAAAVAVPTRRECRIKCCCDDECRICSFVTTFSNSKSSHQHDRWWQPVRRQAGCVGGQHQPQQATAQVGAPLATLRNHLT